MPRLTLTLPSKSLTRLYLLLPFVLTACATIPSGGQQFEHFSDYAESVFRRQNALSSRLMMLNEDEPVSEEDSLEDKEQAMHEACHLLNEYAEMESSGEFISPLFARSVQNSIENCDRHIQALEIQLDRSCPK